MSLRFENILKIRIYNENVCAITVLSNIIHRIKAQQIAQKNKQNVLIYNIIGIVGSNNVSALKLEFESILSHENIRCSKGKRP